MEKVENLSKILISVLAGTQLNRSDLSPEPIKSEFIFGLGTAGLTAFEYELSGKCTGDEVSLAIRAEDVHQIFEHICIPLPALPESCSTYYLKIRIDKIANISASEVVKAMSGLAGCGGHDCGCGCH